MAEELTDLMFDGRKKIAIQKKKWSQNFKAMLDEDIITESERDEEEQVLKEWIAKMRNTLNDKIELFSSSHIEALKVTLKVLDQRNILKIGE